MCFSLLNVNQKTRRVQILTEMYLMRNLLKKRSWQPLRQKVPKECQTVPSSTQAWEIFISSFFLLSMYLLFFIVVSILLLSSVPCGCSIQDLSYARNNYFLPLFLLSLFPDGFLMHQGRNVTLDKHK